MLKFTSLCFFLLSLTVHASRMSWGSCDVSAGKSDSNVLALSSQPGFCQTYGYEVGKPECNHLSKNSYQATHFTLHGLWPTQSSCGQAYGFCGVKQRLDHCDYEPVELSPGIAEHLKKTNAKLQIWKLP